MLVAARLLKLRGKSEDMDVPIRIFAPEQAKDGSWSCRYEIDWPGQTREMASAGADSVQAVFLAMQMIGSELYTSSFHKLGKLFFLVPGQGYGFPVPAGLRDLLEGDDATYL